MTTFSRMPSKKQHILHTSPKGDVFNIEVEIFDTPAEQNYWSVFYRVDHEEYGKVGLYGVFPKEQFPTFQNAILIHVAQPLDRVKSILNNATKDGFIRQFILSPDGWYIF